MAKPAIASAPAARPARAVGAALCDVVVGGGRVTVTVTWPPFPPPPEPPVESGGGKGLLFVFDEGPFVVTAHASLKCWQNVAKVLATILLLLAHCVIFVSGHIKYKENTNHHKLSEGRQWL